MTMGDAAHHCEQLEALLSEHEALRAQLGAASEQIEAICSLLAHNGCDCDCDHHHEEHDIDCDRCLACRVNGVIVGSPVEKPNE